MGQARPCLSQPPEYREAWLQIPTTHEDMRWYGWVLLSSRKNVP